MHYMLFSDRNVFDKISTDCQRPVLMFPLSPPTPSLALEGLPPQSWAGVCQGRAGRLKRCRAAASAQTVVGELHTDVMVAPTF